MDDKWTAHSVVLVTGATGALGPRIVEGIHQSGYSVRVLAIDPPAPHLFPPSTDFRLGDINDDLAVRSALADVEIVIHMAAMVHMNTISPKILALYERVNVAGTASIINASIKASVRRIVFFSTIAVYGEGHGRILDENSTPQPATPYADTKLRAERLVLSARRPDGRPIGTVLRLASVYGSRVKGNYRRLARALGRRRFIPIGSGLNRRTLVYDRDVAQAALATARHPEAAGRIYNVTDGKIHTINEIILTICEALGREAPLMRLPLGPVTSVADIFDKGNRFLRLGLLDLGLALNKYVEDMAVEGQRIVSEIGFEPKYNLRAGWKESIKEMRETGII